LALKLLLFRFTTPSQRITFFWKNQLFEYPEARTFYPVWNNFWLIFSFFTQQLYVSYAYYCQFDWPIFFLKLGGYLICHSILRRARLRFLEDSLGMVWAAVNNI